MDISNLRFQILRCDVVYNSKSVANVTLSEFQQLLFTSLTHQAVEKFSLILFHVPVDFCDEFSTLESTLS